MKLLELIQKFIKGVTNVETVKRMLNQIPTCIYSTTAGALPTTLLLSNFFEIKGNLISLCMGLTDLNRNLNN